MLKIRDEFDRGNVPIDPDKLKIGELHKKMVILLQVRKNGLIFQNMNKITLIRACFDSGHRLYGINKLFGEHDNKFTRIHELPYDETKHIVGV